LYETGRRGRDSLMVVSDDGMVNAYLSQSSAMRKPGVVARWHAHLLHGTRERVFQRETQRVKFDPASGARLIPRFVTLRRRIRRRMVRPQSSLVPDSNRSRMICRKAAGQRVSHSSGGGSPKRSRTAHGKTRVPCFPDGKSIALVSNRGTPEVHTIEIVPVDGSAAQQFARFHVGYRRIRAPVVA